MKKYFTVFMLMMVSVMATAQCNVFMIEPTMKLNFVDGEDVFAAANKLKKAFDIDGEPTKFNDNYVLKQTPLLQDVEIHYIIHSYGVNQLRGISIIIKGDNTEFIDKMIDTFDMAFYNSPLYEYDGEDYSNSKIWVSFTKTNGTDHAVIMILPLPQ